MGKSTPPAVAPEVCLCNLANSSEASRKHEGYLSLRAGVDYHYLQIGQCSVVPRLAASELLKELAADWIYLDVGRFLNILIMQKSNLTSPDSERIINIH